MESLANASPFCGGYGMRLAYIIQDKAQLKAATGALLRWT